MVDNDDVAVLDHNVAGEPLEYQPLEAVSQQLISFTVTVDKQRGDNGLGDMATDLKVSVGPLRALWGATTSSLFDHIRAYMKNVLCFFTKKLFIFLYSVIVVTS